MSGIWEEIDIFDWGQYVTFLKSKSLFSKLWIFRGQSESSHGIRSSFDRIFEKTFKTRSDARIRTLSESYHLERENAIIAMFKSKSHLYSSLNPEILLTKNNISNFCKYITQKYTDEIKLYEVLLKFEWLTIMQHYSAPTRLIDWTCSPYIAAFFALEDFSENGCVYAFNRNILNDYNDQLSLRSGFRFDVFDGVDEKDDGSFIIYEPIIKNQRIAQQQGLFIVPTTIIKSANEIFDYISKIISKPLGYIIKFNKTSLLESIQELQYMGITSETIYPGIEGLSKSLRFKMIENPDEIR